MIITTYTKAYADMSLSEKLDAVRVDVVNLLEIVAKDKEINNRVIALINKTIKQNPADAVALTRVMDISWMRSHKETADQDLDQYSERAHHHKTALFEATAMFREKLENLHDRYMENSKAYLEKAATVCKDAEFNFESKHILAELGQRRNLVVDVVFTGSPAPCLVAA